GDAHRERVHKRGKGLRLPELGLAVADPQLDGREREMWPYAPPELRGLGDRPRVVEEADVVLILRPVPKGVGNPAAREHAREDLRPRRVQIRVDALDERRAPRVGEQLREEAAERVRDE